MTGEVTGLHAKSPNTRLAALLQQARWSNKGTAARVRAEASARGQQVGTTTSRVSAWLAGDRPHPDTVALLTAALSRALGRTVTAADAGFADHGSGDHPRGLSPGPVRLDTVEELPRLAPGAIGRRREDGDRVLRRDLLRDVAAAAAGAVVPGRETAGGAREALIRSLHASALPTGEPPTLAALSGMLAGARADFGACRYQKLETTLPGLIASARAARQAANLPQRAAADAVLTQTYALTTRLMIKAGDDGIAAVTADRALASARGAGDPALSAEATRMVSSVLRRTGHRASAGQLLEQAAAVLDAEAGPSPRALAVLAHLLCTNAYTAAGEGDRARALALIAEAEELARRLPDEARHAYLTSGSPVNVLLHRVSVCYLLGDAGAAIDAARGLDPALLGVRERQARFYTDLARAFHLWGKDGSAFRALVAAYRAAPEELGRPGIRAMVSDLVHRDRTGSETLRQFAVRVGVR